MSLAQYEIREGIQENRFISRKWILNVFRYNLPLPIWPVVLCPSLQDFSEGSRLFEIEWLLFAEFFSNSFMPSKCFLVFDINTYFGHLYYW